MLYGLPALTTNLLCHDALVLGVVLLNGALLHAQDVADGVEVEVLAVLLPDTLLHELVPVEGRERPGRKIQVDAKE